MEISTRIVFALLLTISLQDRGDFSPASERAELSLTLIQSNTDEKVLNVDQKASDQNTNLEWVRSEGVPKDAVFYSNEGKQHYIAKYNSTCEVCFFDSISKSCLKMLSTKKWESVKILTFEEILFLVNRDNFELLEWKKCTINKFPPMSVVVCGKFIVNLNMSTQTDGEALAINNDIKVQHLNVVEYLISSAVTSENLEVLKHFKASNMNCKPSKHTVKLDQNIDKTYSYQIGKIHTFGFNSEVSVSGEIPTIAKILGKLGFKYEHTRSRNNTTSVLEKNLHSVSTDVEIPPHHSCTVDITSNILKTEVPFTGEITRVYNNKQIRKTLVNGTYIHQEVDEIETLVNPCQQLSGRTNC
ncbi:natterin-3-like [Danio aesculapii]|uniref:natterin-3-like n=1 Tax=Danio aesculapii TaxID=1142201 RepID=UPI0024BFC0BD|nr:natterin-3-like [Danio aesculapii]